MLGHTKYKCVQEVYCSPSPEKPYYGSNRLESSLGLVMILQPGIDNEAFVVSDAVWYPQARVLLLSSASAMIDTGSKPFDCTLISTLET
jgi:hypothetical protein